MSVEDTDATIRQRGAATTRFSIFKHQDTAGPVAGQRLSNPFAPVRTRDFEPGSFFFEGLSLRQFFKVAEIKSLLVLAQSHSLGL